jgi:hypothetical protein
MIVIICCLLVIDYVFHNEEEDCSQNLDGEKHKHQHTECLDVRVDWPAENVFTDEVSKDDSSSSE